MPLTKTGQTAGTKGTKCMVPGCKRKHYTRGVCHACYQTFQNAKRAGEITDEEAVAARLILPARSHIASPMTAAIKATKKS